ncbi:MAG: sulfite exporter TauE/SafE family protein [Anaerolineales bacterium]|nr:sulfite exporter TauE/SafE family protein [Anaerolineales bacterium]
MNLFIPTRPFVFYVAVALACYLAGLSKGGLGGTMGFLLTPLVSLVMPVNQAVGLLLPILILADIFAIAAYWRRWDNHHVRILMVGALIGVTLATFVLTNFPPQTLKKGLAIIILLFVVYRLFERRILGNLHYQTRRWHATLAGSLAGFTSTLAHAGGPPITIYLLMQKLSPDAFIASSALFFALLNWIKVPYYYFAGLFDFRLLLSLVWMAPLAPLGVWSGRILVKRVDRAMFEWVIIALLLISGVLLLRS